MTFEEVYLLFFTIILGVPALWLLSKLVFSSYFDAKEKFVDRLVHKERGTEHE